MSDKTQDGTEETSADAEVVADGVEDTIEDTSNSELFESEPSTKENDLDLSDEEEKVDKAKEQRDKQVDAYVNKALKGEIDLDSLPKELKWLKGPVEAKLAELNITPDVEAIVEKKLTERLEKQTFQQMKEKLGGLKLTPDLKKELSSEFKDFRSAGLSSAQALTKALKVVQIDLNNEEEAIQERRDAMQIPKGGGPARGEAELTAESVVKIKDPAKRLAALEKLRKMKK